MAYQDPNSRPQRTPRLNPLPLGANPPLYRDDDGGSDRHASLIVTSVIALLAVVGLIMWFGPAGPQIADDPPVAQTASGQGGQVPLPIASRPSRKATYERPRPQQAPPGSTRTPALSPGR